MPQGTYVLEAEDSDYYYFLAPASIEMRVLAKGVPLEHWEVPGGVALAKSPLRLLSPATYIEIEGAQKLFVMKLGSDFLRMRDKQWMQSY